MPPEVTFAGVVALLAGGPRVDRGGGDAGDVRGEASVKQGDAGAGGGVVPASVVLRDDERVQQTPRHLVETRAKLGAQVGGGAGGKRLAGGPAGEELGLHLARGLDLRAEKRLGLRGRKAAVGGLLREGFKNGGFAHGIVDGRARVVFGTRDLAGERKTFGHEVAEIVGLVG